MKKILLLISIIIGVVASITVAAYDVSLNPSDTFQVLECNNEDGNHQMFQATVNIDRD